MSIKDKIKENPEIIFTMKKISFDYIVEAVKANPFLINHFMSDKLYDIFESTDIDSVIMNYDGLSQNRIRELIIKQPRTILKISNPTEDMKLLAVNRSPRLIFELDRPSEDLLRAAIKNKPMLIQYIFEPSEELQMICVTQTRKYLSSITRPCRAVQQYVLNYYPDYIHHLRFIEDDIVIDYINKNGLKSITRLPKISDKVRAELTSNIKLYK